MKVIGEIHAGEATSAIASIQSRQRGSRWMIWAIYAACIVGGGVLGLGVGVLLDRLTHAGFWTELLWVVGAVLGAVVYIRLCRPFVVSRFRRSMEARSLPSIFNQSIEVTDEGLRSESLGVESLARWSAVTEVFPSKGYWIFLVAMGAWFVPKRFFASPEQERAFLKASLEHMSPDGRKRSSAAVSATNI